MQRGSGGSAPLTPPRTPTRSAPATSAAPRPSWRSRPGRRRASRWRSSPPSCRCPRPMSPWPTRPGCARRWLGSSRSGVTPSRRATAHGSPSTAACSRTPRPGRRSRPSSGCRQTAPFAGSCCSSTRTHPPPALTRQTSWGSPRPSRARWPGSSARCPRRAAAPSSTSSRTTTCAPRAAGVRARTSSVGSASRCPTAAHRPSKGSARSSSPTTAACASGTPPETSPDGRSAAAPRHPGRRATTSGTTNASAVLRSGRSRRWRTRAAPRVRRARCP